MKAMSKITDHLAKIEAWCRFKSENLRLGGLSNDHGAGFAIKTLALPAVTAIMTAVACAHGTIISPDLANTFFTGALVAGWSGIGIQAGMQALARNSYEANEYSENAKYKDPLDITHSDKVNTHLDKLYKSKEFDAFDAGNEPKDLSRFKAKDTDNRLSY